MLESVLNSQEKVANFTRQDSELTVATVETFLSETSVSTETAGGGGEKPEKPAETNDKTNNAQELFQRGFLSQFYHKNFGTIILISTSHIIRDISTRIPYFLSTSK